MNWLEIPLSQVDRIEIVRGGNGVLFYGDAAVGATIQIITKQERANRREVFPLPEEAIICIMNGSSFRS